MRRPSQRVVVVRSFAKCVIRLVAAAGATAAGAHLDIDDKRTFHAICEVFEDDVVAPGECLRAEAFPGRRRQVLDADATPIESARPVAK